MSNTNTPENLRLKEAAEYLGVSLATLWRLGDTDPTFPKKIKFSSRCCIYRKSSLDKWLSSKEV